MVAAGLLVSRFLHLMAVLLLFGAAAFPLYAYPEAERAAQSDLLFARLGRVLLAGAILALISGITWLCFTAASMSNSIANAVDPGILSIVIRETDFGRVWIWRLALAAILVVLFAFRRRSETLALLQIGGSALLLTSISGTGHAGSDATSLGTFHVAADSLHLLAASAWLGGLLSLGVMLSKHASLEYPDVARMVHRFSGMGVVAVAAIIASGIVNSLFQVDGFGPLVSTLYGRVLLIKLALFAGMLGYAAANRFRIWPELAKGPDCAGPSLKQLRRNVAAEQILGVLVLAAVACLGALEPAHFQAE